jgi:drug/metabolite transporter (DMT)-like permease
MSHARANMFLLFAGAIWGMGFVAQSSAMDNVGPWFFIGLRFAVATLTMLPMALRENIQAKALPARSDLLKFAGIGLTLFLGMAAQQSGLLTTSVTNSGFLTALYLIMVPLLGIVLFRQMPHVVIWPAALCALFGIYLLSGGRLEALRQGDVLTVICAFFWALQILLINRYANASGRPVTLAVTQFAVTAVLGFAAAFSLERVDWTAAILAAPEILFAGVFAGGLAFTFQAVGQRHTTASQAAIILSSEALFAALFGALIMRDRLPPTAWLGCALIFAAILAAELVPALMARRATAEMTAAP